MIDLLHHQVARQTINCYCRLGEQSLIWEMAYLQESLGSNLLLILIILIKKFFRMNYVFLALLLYFNIKLRFKRFYLY